MLCNFIRLINFRLHKDHHKVLCYCRDDITVCCDYNTFLCMILHIVNQTKKNLRVNICIHIQEVITNYSMRRFRVCLKVKLHYQESAGSVLN